MNNILVGIKRFLGNKNTVTIMGVLAGIAVLYIGYNWRVKQAIEPKSVPYAKQEIAANTLITNDMVGSVKVSKSMVDSTQNLATSNNQVVGKYVAYDSTIPEGSLFYKSQLMTEEQLPNYIVRNIPEGYTVYSLEVNSHLTYANSIMPNDYIDLYFKAMDDENKVIFTKLIESIKVIAVKDSQGKSVFSSESKNSQPAELVFAVPDDMFLLLKKSDYITSNSIAIVPVPRNANYTENPNATQVASDVIIDFILSKSAYIPENTTNSTDDNNTNNNG
ncbi:MAG: Flp pilus assembly protein CpaB [Tenericutes bacterium]|nr:Flp pilus assembly protein CpaB [Mycoplasmatota bacterium]